MVETEQIARSALLAESKTVLLTTFRASGQGVSTPVSLAVRAGRAYFVTPSDSGKAKRLARCSRVELTPCTTSGTPVGITVGGRARPVEGTVARDRGLLRPAGPVFWSWLMYRARGRRMRFYEVEPASPTGG